MNKLGNERTARTFRGFLLSGHILWNNPRQHARNYEFHWGVWSDFTMKRTSRLLDSSTFSLWPFPRLRRDDLGFDSMPAFVIAEEVALLSFCSGLKKSPPIQKLKDVEMRKNEQAGGLPIRK